jgi:hypothetical protein
MLIIITQEQLPREVNQSRQINTQKDVLINQRNIIMIPIHKLLIGIFPTFDNLINRQKDNSNV